MRTAILTFDAFNELDSFIALGILNRIKEPGWEVVIASPEPRIQSMNGVWIDAHITIEEACRADAVLVGSGMKTRDVIADSDLMAQIQLNPDQQLIGAQCSGTLLLAKKGLLNEVPACTDLTTQPWVEESGVQTLEQPFFAKDNLATSGGCLSSSYLACWVIAKAMGERAAEEAMFYVAPVGEKSQYVEMMQQNVFTHL
jgi:transcriptional regulator GlxA family with amidase domain